MTAQLDESLKPFEGWKIPRTPKGTPKRSGAKLLAISFQGPVPAQEFPRKLRFKNCRSIVSDVKNEWIQTLDIEKKDMKHSRLHFLREGIHEVAKNL